MVTPVSSTEGSGSQAQKIAMQIVLESFFKEAAKAAQLDEDDPDNFETPLSGYASEVTSITLAKTVANRFG
jgi:hypothetical protein